MPTYAYACTACGHDFEAVQSFHEDSLTECPQCQGRLRKVFSNVGVVFKGSGFYRNDSRTSADKPADKTGDKPADKTGDKPAEKATATSSNGSDGSGGSGSGGSASKPAAATTSGSKSTSRSGSAA